MMAIYDEKTNPTKIVLRFLMNNTFIKRVCRNMGVIYRTQNNFNNLENFEAIHSFYTRLALLHKDLKVKTSHIYSNLSDNSGMWSA